MITLSSVIAQWGGPRLSAYLMSRAAVEAMTRTMAAEWAYAPAQPIRLNCVAPAGIATEMLAPIPDWYAARSLQATALRRFGQPEEVAGAVVYLLSDAARFVTGTVLEVSSGYGMWSLDPAPPRPE